MSGNNSNNNQMTERFSQVGVGIPVGSKTLVKKAGRDTEAWPGQKVECRVTEYNENDVSKEDKDRVQWKTRIDGEYTDLDVKGDKVPIEIKKEWAGKEVFVMPYLHSAKVGVEVKINVRSFPIIIAESHRKRELNDEGLLADDLQCGDLTKDEILKMYWRVRKYHATKGRTRYSYLEKFENADFHFHAFEFMVTTYFASDKIKLNKIKIPKDLSKDCEITEERVVVDLKTNIKRMIKHFKEGDRKKGDYNIGKDYIHNDLTTAVLCHPDTIRFFNEIRKGLAKKLKEHNGDIVEIEKSKLANIARPRYGTFGWNSIVSGFDEMRSGFDDVRSGPDGIPSGLGSIFIGLDDIRQGINDTQQGIKDGRRGYTISLHDTWAYEVLITKYSLSDNGRTYSGEMKIIIYDHFGLDDDDIKPGKLAAKFRGFFSWFALQRWDGFEKKYKPFVAVIEHEFPFEGEL